MPFFVNKGTFHVKGYSPDGDSVRFKATDPSHWGLLDGPSHLSSNSKKHVQLRLEGIDTLETHFSAPDAVRMRYTRRNGRSSANASWMESQTASRSSG